MSDEETETQEEPVELSLEARLDALDRAVVALAESDFAKARLELSGTHVETTEVQDDAEEEVAAESTDES